MSANLIHEVACLIHVTCANSIHTCGTEVSYTRHMPKFNLGYIQVSCHGRDALWIVEEKPSAVLDLDLSINLPIT